MTFDQQNSSIYTYLCYSVDYPTWGLVKQNIGKILPNLEIHKEVYILIELCSAEARDIISTGSTKFHAEVIF